MKRFIPLQSAELTRAKADGDLVVSMAFSSEEPVERWWGTEILDHAENSIRLERLNDGAPVLYNHNPNDLRGVHESGSVKVGKDRVLRGKVRITAATQAGRDAIGLVEGRVLTKASIGYRVHKVVEQSTKRDGTKVERVLDGGAFERLIDQYESRGPDLAAFRRDLDALAGAAPLGERKEDEDPIYRVMDWEPIENSFVTIPSDNTVGIGRSSVSPVDTQVPAVSPSAVTAATIRSITMKTPEQLAAEAAEAAAAAEKQRKEEQDRLEREAREQLSRRSIPDMEAGRTKAIKELAQANRIDDSIRDTWISQGYSLEQVAADILNIHEQRGKTNPQPLTRLGMSQSEAQRFSFSRAIVAVVDGNWKDAGFELECSRALAQKLGRVADPKKFLVPFEVMERSVDMRQVIAQRMSMGLPVHQRDLTAAVAGAGGYLVETENMGFIEMLRNRSVAFRMGVRRLSGLSGNVTVPRQSAAATAFWLANEGTQITESTQTFVQLALSPKTVGAYTEISRQLLLQSSPGAEGIVTDDLAQVVALGADLAVLEGSGAAGQPTGISATAGIGSVTGTTLGYAGILEFQVDVATSNVTPLRGGYVTTPAVAALLMQRARFSNTDTPLWVGNIWDGQVAGFPAMSSNQPAAASMIFGDWQEAVVGEWGVLEVSVNPFANFQAGIIGVRAIYSMDVGVRRPFAFSRATTIT
jgi:HK97 family phage major capsid protein